MSKQKRVKQKSIRGQVVEVFEEYDGCLLMSVVSDYGDEHLVLAEEVPGDPFDWLDCVVRVKGLTTYVGEQRVIDPRYIEKIEDPPGMMGDKAALYGDPDWYDRDADGESDEYY